MISDPSPPVLSALPADRSDKRLALAVALGSAAIFAALAPFAKTPVAPVPAFIPAYQVALILADLITTTLLIGQLRVVRSRALLVLAGGYLYTALLALAHMLSFPGAFAPQGLIGGGAQTTAYLFVFWHSGFPLFVIAYALARGAQSNAAALGTPLVAGAVGAVLALVAAVLALVTLGHDLLPQLLQGNQYSSAFNVGRHGQWIVTAAAILVLWRRRPHSVLDLWVMVTLCAWWFEIALVAIFNSGRWDVGFYAGRVYGLLASLFVLAVLLMEQAGVYASLFRAHERSVRESAERESEARFRVMAEELPELAWMARPDGWIYWYNRRWYEYTGTRPEDMEGWGWRRVHDPRRLPAVLAGWQRSIDTGEPFEMTFPLLGADGRFRSFLTRVAPVKDEAGRVLHWLGINTDVTAQHAAQEALREADRRKDVFLATLAHELRNPLAAIRNSIALIERARPLPQDADAATRIVDRQVSHLTRLVDDLLEVARIAQGKIELRRSRVALQAPLRDALQAMDFAIRGTGCSVSLELPAEPIMVEADPTRVAQIVSNLLSNALKFTPAGGRIALAARREGGEAIVSVRDTGAGIPQEHLRRVFDMFAQVSEPVSRAHGGLGIGLALVRGLVESHGGRVEAHSDGPGKGSEFVVRLPLAGDGLAPRAEPAAPASAAPGRLRVLVVDDNVDAAGTLAKLLQIEGHEVREAHDGLEGVRAAAEFRPDVVLLDIGMPRMNGYEAAAEIRRRLDSEVRIIALTGWGQEADRAASARSGIDLHLTKPVEFERLQSLLK